MAKYGDRAQVYAVGVPYIQVENLLVKAQRAPRVTDHKPAGTKWIDQTNNDVYNCIKTSGGSTIWIGSGGGTGDFNTLAVTTAAVIGTDLTAGGAITFSGLATAGVVLNSAAGLLSTIPGTNGQLLIGATGGQFAAATLASAGGTMVITNGANTINVEATGGTANSYTTSAGGPVAPLAGVLNVIGYDANITTDGSTANTIKVRLADDVVSVASVTATNDFTMTAGTFTVNSDDNSANAIKIEATAGVNEEVHIASTLGTSAQAVYIHADAGGVTFESGSAAASAFYFDATGANGGFTADVGTAGFDFAATNGPLAFTTGTGNIFIGVDVTDHDIAIGDDSGVNAMSLTAGTGNLAATSTGTITMDSAGALDINSSGGIIGIGNDAVAQNINIGTSGVRTISIGNSTALTSVVIDCGAGGALTLGTNATAHQTTVGSTNTTSALTLQSGTGNFVQTAGGIWDVNAVGAATIDSTGAAISIGAGADDFAVNISTGGTRLTTIGNSTATSSVAILSGTSGIDIGVNAIAKTCRLGSTTGVSATTIQCGTGALTVTAGDALNEAVTGVLTSTFASYTATSSGDVAQAIYLHSNGGTSETIEVVNTQGTDAAAIALTSTAGGIVVSADTTTGIKLDAEGSVDNVADTGTNAASTLTLNKRVGIFTATGLTTAAAGTQRYTITNSKCIVTSGLMVTVSNKSAGNDCKITMEACTPGAGSFTVDTKNNGGQALDSDVIISWIVLN